MMPSSWRAGHDRRRALRQRREQQDRLNQELNSHPTKREGYGKVADDSDRKDRVWIERIDCNSHMTSREVPYEPWMRYGDWIPWPHDPEADEYDRRYREEREQRRRWYEERRDTHAGVRFLSLSDFLLARDL